MQGISDTLRDLGSSDVFVWTLEVEVPTDPPTRYRFTSDTRAVEFGQTSSGVAIVYSRFAYQQGEFRHTNKGELPSLGVTVSNVTMELVSALDTHDGLIGQPVVVHLLNRSDQRGTGYEIRLDGQIKGCSATMEAVTISVGALDLSNANLPRNRYSADHCDVRQFGDGRCGYVIPDSPTNAVGGGFDFCQRTFTACRERGADEAARAVDVKHPARFGGFPGMRK